MQMFACTVWRGFFTTLPFIILVFTVLHILCLHKYGSSNPLGIDSVDMVTFYPKYVIKDIFGFLILWCCVVVNCFLLS